MEVEIEKVHRSLSELHVKVALTESNVMDRVRDEFASKEDVARLSTGLADVDQTVRRLEKFIHTATIILGILLFFGRTIAKYIFG